MANEHIVVECAWCHVKHRLSLDDPIWHDGPAPAGDWAVSHGMCPSCEQRVREEEIWLGQR